MAHQTSWAGRSLGKFPEFWWQKTFNTGCDVGEIRICCSWSPGGKMFHYRRFHIKFRTTSNCFFFAQIISETERDIFFLNFLEIFLRHFFLRLRDNFCRQRGGALHCFPSSITTTDTSTATTLATSTNPTMAFLLFLFCSPPLTPHINTSWY